MLLYRYAGLAASLLLATSCDFAASGDPPLSEPGPFSVSAHLSFDAEAAKDTLHLARHTLLTFGAVSGAPIGEVRVFVGDTLVARLPGTEPTRLDLSGIPDGLTTLRVEAQVQYLGGATLPTPVLLGTWPVYLDTTPPVLAALDVAVEDGFMHVRWQRGEGRLPAEVEVERKMTGAPSVAARLSTSAPAGSWRDLTYVGGDVVYQVRLRNANGEAVGTVAVQNASARFTARIQQGRHVFTWRRPPGARIGQYVVQRLFASPYAPPRWDDVAVLDSTSRTWSADAVYGESFHYRLAAFPSVPDAPLATYPEQVVAAYGTPVVTTSSPDPQTYLYDSVRDRYYVYDTAELFGWADGDPVAGATRATPFAQVAVGPEGRLFALGTNYAEVRELDPQSFATLGTAQVSFWSGSALGVAAAADGRLAIAAYGRLRTYDFDARRYGPSADLPPGTPTPYAVSTNADGTWIAVNGRVYERTAAALLLRYTAPNMGSTDVDLDALVSYTVEGTTLVTTDVRTGTERARRTLPVSLTRVSLDPHEALLGGEAGGRYYVFQRDTLEPVASIKLAHPTPSGSPSMRGYQVLNGRLFTRYKDPVFFYLQTSSFISLL